MSSDLILNVKTCSAFRPFVSFLLIRGFFVSANSRYSIGDLGMEREIWGETGSSVKLCKCIDF